MNMLTIGLLGVVVLYPTHCAAQSDWSAVADRLQSAFPLNTPSGDAFLRSLAIGGVQSASEILSSSILSSRQQALAEGTAPIPSTIRDRLEGHVPAVDLDAVRWRVGGGDDMSLQRNAIVKGPATAITLLDVVVFADEGDALANAGLWAHELRHVGQYREWGLAAFSLRYITDHQSVENDAVAFAARWRDRSTPRPRPRP